MKRLSSWVGGSHWRWLLSKVSSDAVPTEPGPHTPQIKSFSDLTSSRIFPISPDQTGTSTYHTTLLHFCAVEGLAARFGRQRKPELVLEVFNSISHVFSFTINKS